MPSVYQFLQNPQIYPYQTTLSDNPQILNSFIDYLTKNPDPLINNQQQCYVYPNRAADILSLGTTYKALIAKRQRKNKKTNQIENYYPYLDRLFKNIQNNATQIQQSLLGYTNKVLISLAKKTPQIYQYLKDNQDIIKALVSNGRFLRNFKQFFIIFLIQSTMSLYVFLKNVVIRALMFKIIQQKDIDNLVVYENLYAIYAEINKKLKSNVLPEDQKEQLQEICINFHDQDFITLLILKISSKSPKKTYYICKILNQMLNFPDQKITEVSNSHMQAIQQFFQSYQESSGFLDHLSLDQIQTLKLLIILSQKKLLEHEYQVNFLKRLLVYTSIHKKNSVLHNILFKLIQILTDSDRTEVFNQINVIAFLMKNLQMKDCKYVYGSLIWRICQYWQQNQNKLFKYLGKQQQQLVKQQIQSKNKKFVNLTMYKIIPNNSEIITEKSDTHSDSPQKNNNQQQKPSQSESSTSPQKS